MAVTREENTPNTEIDSTADTYFSGRDLPTVHTPFWRRLTALVSLGSLVVITGIVLATALGISVLLILMVLERAAG